MVFPHCDLSQGLSDNNFIDKRDNSTNGVSSATSVYKGGINPLSLRLMEA